MKKVRLYVILIVAIIAILFTFDMIFPKIPTFVFLLGGVLIGRFISKAEKAYDERWKEQNSWHSSGQFSAQFFNRKNSPTLVVGGPMTINTKL